MHTTVISEQSTDRWSHYYLSMYEVPDYIYCRTADLNFYSYKSKPDGCASNINYACHDQNKLHLI